MDRELAIIQIRPEILKLVKANDGYCPCAIEKTPDTKCMCKDFGSRTSPVSAIVGGS